VSISCSLADLFRSFATSWELDFANNYTLSVPASEHMLFFAHGYTHPAPASNHILFTCELALYFLPPPESLLLLTVANFQPLPIEHIRFTSGLVP